MKTLYLGVTVSSLPSHITHRSPGLFTVIARPSCSPQQRLGKYTDIVTRMVLLAKIHDCTTMVDTSTGEECRAARCRKQTKYQIYTLPCDGRVHDDELIAARNYMVASVDAFTAS
jgi:hypothetical protein